MHFNEVKVYYQYIIGIGSNLPDEGYSTAFETCLSAIKVLQGNPISTSSKMLHIKKLSRWYRCPPVPASNQPWFVNATFSCVSALPPKLCLLWLHKIEHHFGRVRRTRNEARTLDLDIILQLPIEKTFTPKVALQEFSSFEELQSVLNYHQSVSPIIPHLRMNDRHFVLYPLQDIFPDFTHPQTRESIISLIGKLDTSYEIYPIENKILSVGIAK
jgi:2-amino-4-hydroxy-6-hydroxymethyldihydropteridine diphosphokinase